MKLNKLFKGTNLIVVLILLVIGFAYFSNYSAERTVDVRVAEPTRLSVGRETNVNGAECAIRATDSYNPRGDLTQNNRNQHVTYDKFRGEVIVCNVDHIGLVAQLFDAKTWTIVGSEMQLVENDCNKFSLDPAVEYYIDEYSCNDLSCECTGFVSDGCGTAFGCGVNQMSRIQSCSPANCNPEHYCVDWITPSVTGCDVVVKPNCVPDWATGSWGSCVSNQQTRTVVDNNRCNVNTNKPADIQSCNVVKPTSCKSKGTPCNIDNDVIDVNLPAFGSHSPSDGIGQSQVDSSCITGVCRDDNGFPNNYCDTPICCIGSDAVAGKFPHISWDTCGPQSVQAELNSCNPIYSSNQITKERVDQAIGICTGDVKPTSCASPDSCLLAGSCSGDNIIDITKTCSDASKVCCTVKKGEVKNQSVESLTIKQLNDLTIANAETRDSKLKSALCRDSAECKSVAGSTVSCYDFDKIMALEGIKLTRSDFSTWYGRAFDSITGTKPAGMCIAYVSGTTPGDPLNGIKTWIAGLFGWSVDNPYVNYVMIGLFFIIGMLVLTLLGKPSGGRN